MTSRRLTRTARLCCALVVLAALAAHLSDREAALAQAIAPAPQSTPPPAQPTFKVAINYVEITARAVDASGRFVRDLRKEDFSILEDGSPQAIADFKLVNLAAPDLPASAPSAWSLVEDDVRSNAQPFDGRVYVLVLDDVHVMPENTRDVQAAARLFLERYFEDGDLGAIVNTSGRADPAQELTTSRARLLATIGRFAGHRGTVSVAGGSVSLVEDILSSLQSLTTRLDGVRGRRKAIVYFSEGPGISIETGVTDGRSIAEQSEAVFAAANRANVAIYGVDPRGLKGVDVGSPEDSGSMLPGRSTSTPDASPKVLDRGLSDDIRSLRTLSESTGGFAITNANSFTEGFERIREESSNYYVLGYYAPEPKDTTANAKSAKATKAADAKNPAFRKVEIRTTRPGVTVQARKGYVLPSRAKAAVTGSARPGAVAPGSAVLRDAIDSAVPVSGLRLSAVAVPFRADATAHSALVTVALHVDGRDITFRPTETGGFQGSIELTLASMDSRGGVGPSEHGIIPMPLNADAHAVVARDGIRIVRTLPMKPGHYQLRVGAMDTASERTGVVHCDVDVPDYQSAPLVLSGVLLTSSLAGRTPTSPGGPIAELRRQLPGPPALTREFRVGETLVVYAEAYGREARAETLTVQAVVVGEDGQGVMQAIEAQDSIAAEADGRISIRRTVPLKTVTAGRYVLRLIAQAAAGGGGQARTATREIPFTIVQ
jgi:VWFA-related protein